MILATMIFIYSLTVLSLINTLSADYEIGTHNGKAVVKNYGLTLLHSEWTKFCGVLAVLSAKGLTHTSSLQYVVIINLLGNIILIITLYRVNCKIIA